MRTMDLKDKKIAATGATVSIGKAYNTSGDDHTFWEFVQAWRTAGGKTSRLLLPLPVPIKQSFDHSRAAKDLSWRNRPYLDGLRETLALEHADRHR